MAGTCAASAGKPKGKPMHDWTLTTLLFEWQHARVTLTLRTPDSETAVLLATQVVNLSVPKRDPWGPSVSVHEIVGPAPRADGYETLCIRMQSGDAIEITAGGFTLPRPGCRP